MSKKLADLKTIKPIVKRFNDIAKAEEWLNKNKSKMTGGAYAYCKFAIDLKKKEEGVEVDLKTESILATFNGGL